jgi:hypothetical protein
MMVRPGECTNACGLQQAIGTHAGGERGQKAEMEDDIKRAGPQRMVGLWRVRKVLVHGELDLNERGES